VTYTITFEPRQGVLMRILSEATRRAIDLEAIRAVKGCAVLVLDVTEKQHGQLLRAWKSTIDVSKVEWK
jgi:hypothetical protein